MSDWSDHPSPSTLSLFHDGEGPEFLRQEVELHVAECEECRAYLDRLRAITDAFDEAPELESPIDLTTAVRRHIEDETRTLHLAPVGAELADTRTVAPRHLPGRSRWATGWAALLMIGLLAGSWLYFEKWDDWTSSTPTELAKEETPRAESEWEKSPRSGDARPATGATSLEDQGALEAKGERSEQRGRPESESATRSKVPPPKGEIATRSEGHRLDLAEAPLFDLELRVEEADDATLARLRKEIALVVEGPAKLDPERAMVFRLAPYPPEDLDDDVSATGLAAKQQLASTEIPITPEQAKALDAFLVGLWTRSRDDGDEAVATLMRKRPDETTSKSKSSATRSATGQASPEQSWIRIWYPQPESKSNDASEGKRDGQ